jgi:nucleotide-binding universal stress UspA family protein
MLPTITRILFATALSERSATTLRHVIGLAAATGAEIRILHVIEELSEDARLTLKSVLLDDSLVKNRIAETRRILAERQARCWSELDAEAQKVRAQVVATDVLEGFPAEVIVHEAVKHSCNLIVVGTHEKALTHSYLGTVAKRILRHSPVPTLIVPFHDAD